jgi:hypothetical protein
MAGSIRGSNGATPAPAIDEGTLPLNTTLHPRSLGIEPLTVNEPLLQECMHTLFRSIIQEALNRGARDADLSFLRFNYLWMRKIEALGKLAGDGQRAMLATTGETDEESWSQTVVNEESAKFDAIIADDIQRIRAGSWGGSDTAPKDWTGFQGEDDYRYTIRPMYFSQGYTDPAEFLSQQVQFSLFGKPRLKTWVHKDLAAILEKVPGVLEKWTPGLAEATAKDVKGVLGLQMRRIANSEQLSNHAFGCAVDINALANPHVVGSIVVEVFNWVVRRAGITFDFGKSTLHKEEHEPYTKFTVDDIMEIWNRAIPASAAVQQWLQINLPRYRKLMEQVEEAELSLGIKNVNSKKSLASRYQAAQDAATRIKQKRNSSKKPDAGTQDSAGENSEDTALGEIDSAFQQITSDPDLSRIQTLHENYTTDYINTWKERGVMGIPMYLAAALVGELNLDWGEEYESSKDAMHFELLGNRKGWQAYIKPKDGDKLGKNEKPRTLKRLIDTAFQTRMPKWRLEATLR